MPTTLVRTTIALLAATSLVAGCGSSDSPRPSAAAANTGAPAAVSRKATAPYAVALAAEQRPVEPAPLCSVSDIHPTSGDQVMRSHGDSWRYHQDLPSGYDGQSAAPLVIVLGPAPAAADLPEVGADPIVVSVPTPHLSRGWTAVDRDERFVRDLVLRLEERVCFDRANVRLTGVGVGEDIAEHVVTGIHDDRLRFLPLQGS